MFTLLKFVFKLPPFSLLTLPLRYKRKLPGLLWVGGLGYLGWKKFGPQITAKLQATTADYPPPADGPWSGPTGGDSGGSTGAAAEPTPAMAPAQDLSPANAAPVTTPEPDAETEIEPEAEAAETGITGLVVGDDDAAPDPAPVTTTG